MLLEDQESKLRLLQKTLLEDPELRLIWLYPEEQTKNITEDSELKQMLKEFFPDIDIS